MSFKSAIIDLVGKLEIVSNNVFFKHFFIMACFFTHLFNSYSDLIKVPKSFWMGHNRRNMQKQKHNDLFQPFEHLINSWYFQSVYDVINLIK